MFNYTITVSVEEGTPFSELKSTLLKNKKVKKVSKASTKVKEEMTDYYADGKQLSVKAFKSRIAAAEADVKYGRTYSPEEMKKEMEEWKKKKGYK